MKHLLNSLTENEKNSIREQHTGGMKVMTESFSRLLNAKLGDAKPLVNEATSAPEPIISDSKSVIVYYDNEGASKLSNNMVEDIVGFLTPLLQSSIKVIEKYYRGEDFKLPKFITIGTSTTSGGNYKANKVVAQKRIDVVVDIVESLMKNIGYNDEMIQSLLTTNTDYNYTPTSLDTVIYDRKRVKPKDDERFLYLKINGLDEKGLDEKGIDNIEDLLKRARGINFNPDEKGIADAICSLETYSDIKDLDNELRSFGGLEAFINQTITAGITTYGDDTKERNQIVKCLNDTSKTSVDGVVIAKTVGHKISILLP